MLFQLLNRRREFSQALFDLRRRPGGETKDEGRI
jgi:hypothetical protein